MNVWLGRCAVGLGQAREGTGASGVGGSRPLDLPTDFAHGPGGGCLLARPADPPPGAHGQTAPPAPIAGARGPPASVMIDRLVLVLVVVLVLVLFSTPASTSSGCRSSRRRRVCITIMRTPHPLATCSLRRSKPLRPCRTSTRMRARGCCAGRPPLLLLRCTTTRPARDTALLSAPALDWATLAPDRACPRARHLQFHAFRPGPAVCHERHVVCWPAREKAPRGSHPRMIASPPSPCAADV